MLARFVVIPLGQYATTALVGIMSASTMRFQRGGDLTNVLVLGNGPARSVRLSRTLRGHKLGNDAKSVATTKEV